VTWSRQPNQELSVPNIMKTFDDYFTDEIIILSLCKIRAKYAKQRSRLHLIHLLSDDKKLNYHLNKGSNASKIDADLKKLNSLLPCRRKWKKLNKKNRYQKNNQRLNSIDYNTKSLLITIDYYKKNKPAEPFLQNLHEFIKDVRSSINDPDYIISPPKIIPKPKNTINPIKNICRPISLFTLKDRLIISIANKYFTDIFDNYFYSKSFAFRAVQTNGKKKSVLTHHDAIQAILDYKKKYQGKRLWVAECDISKFYDSVHHTIVKKEFSRLLRKVKKDKSSLYDERANRLFLKYLDSYSFVKNVLPFNRSDKKSYWDDKKIPNGRFGWVAKKIVKLGYFKNVKNAKIGVAQGGALSGLIANLVLNSADNKVNNSSDSRLLYVRFCDDMILIHPSKKECLKASKVYFESLKKLHLIPHEFQTLKNNTSESFWNKDIKSKNPYKWSSNYPDSFPWFGFVGYEIHYSGDLRVRKSSLLKEKAKQKEVILQIIRAILKKRRKSKGTIFESAVNRLIGMSVGRVNLNNFNSLDNEMCWVNGFVKINDNRHIRAQLKDLDRYRSKQISRLLQTICDSESGEPKSPKTKIGKWAFIQIRGISEKESEEIRDQLVANGTLNSKFFLKKGINLDDDMLDLGLTGKYQDFNDEILTILKHPTENREIIYYGKPFSYFYQAIERKSLQE